MTTYYIYNGQTISDLTLVGGDTVYLFSGSAQNITLNGPLFPTGGSYANYANVTAMGGQISGLTALAGAAVVQGATISNSSVGPNDYVQIYQGSTVNGLTVAGNSYLYYDYDTSTTNLSLGPNASLDFTNFPFLPNATASVNPATDVLTTISGGLTSTLGLVGNYARDDISLSVDDGMHAQFTPVIQPPGTILTVHPFVVPIDSKSSMVLGSGHVVALNPGESLVTSTGGNTLNVTTTGTVVSNGADTIRGGTGATVVTTAGSGATVVGGTGALADAGGAGNNLVFAGTGGLTYTGGSGFDMVVGQGNRAVITGGTGGGEFFGGGNATITAGAGGAINVEIGGKGDQLFAAGPNGVLFGTSGGDMLMSSAADTANSVFFGAGGSGRMTFITGAGNDILALGQGTDTVTLGSGHDTIFGNGGTTSVSTITAGSGSLDLAFSGASTVLNIAAGAARAFNLFAYVAGADTVHLSGYSATQVADAVAKQTNIGLGAQLTFGDNSTVLLVGVQRATAGLFS